MINKPNDLRKSWLSETWANCCLGYSVMPSSHVVLAYRPVFWEVVVVTGHKSSSVNINSTVMLLLPVGKGLIPLFWPVYLLKNTNKSSVM